MKVSALGDTIPALQSLSSADAPVLRPCVLRSAEALSCVYILHITLTVQKSVHCTSHMDRWWDHMRQFCFMTASCMVAKSQRWQKSARGGTDRRIITWQRSQNHFCVSSCFKRCLQAVHTHTYGLTNWKHHRPMLSGPELWISVRQLV